MRRLVIFILFLASAAVYGQAGPIELSVDVDGPAYRAGITSRMKILGGSMEPDSLTRGAAHDC